MIQSIYGLVLALEYPFLNGIVIWMFSQKSLYSILRITQ